MDANQLPSAEIRAYVDERIDAAIAKHAQDAFVHSAAQHRLTHESMEGERQERRDLWRAVRNHVAAGVVMAALLLLGISVSEWVRAWVLR